jgi:hypothetical protein
MINSTGEARRAQGRVGSVAVGVTGRIYTIKKIDTTNTLTVGTTCRRQIDRHRRR